MDATYIILTPTSYQIHVFAMIIDKKDLFRGQERKI